MPTTAYSILDDPFISVRTTDDRVQGLTLPQILEALAEDRVHSFDALQPHQRKPWFSFLVQVATIALSREGSTELYQSAEKWRQALLSLSDGSTAAWCLINDDHQQPALFQSPIPEGSIDDAGFKADTPSPDDLDMLITSKTHDIKQNRIIDPDPEHWFYALMTLQTMEGFLGVGNYGIVRMNGGFGSRPHLGIAPGLDWNSRFRRDVKVLLEHRPVVVENYEFKPQGQALLWLEPWDGKKAGGIPLKDCDPYFIEICRRLRFQFDDDRIVCWRNNTKATRIDAPDDLNGRTGDPWTPIDISGDKALTLGDNGYSYELLQDIWLNNDSYEKPPALKFHDDDPGHSYLIADTLIRGQGKTKGLRHRIIPIPTKVRRLFSNSKSAREKLAKRSKYRVQLAAEVQKQVLQGPIFNLVYGGRSPSDADWSKINMWIDDFGRQVDAHFFDELWASIEADLSDEDARIKWQKTLRELAESQYNKVRDSIPLPSIHRYRILSEADGQFWGQLKKVLPRTFQSDESNESTESTANEEHPSTEPTLA